MRSFLKCLLMMAVSIVSLQSFASMLEIEKQCIKMYQNKMTGKKLKSVCYCITSNVRDRFNDQQIEELTLLYIKRSSRYEASKNDRLKAITEFDYYTHTSCLKNTAWHFPKDDIGHPDETNR